MGRLKYFKYEGEQISKEQLDNVEIELTEIINKISAYREILLNKHNALWDIIYPTIENGQRPRDEKMFIKFGKELENLSKNISRFFYDVDYLKTARGILRRYNSYITEKNND